ncbi:MAG: Asp-tRNA(Asn)/Glu-tRNA(Gln) amidotransferase subunit GatC [Myxococcaceae bacterium]|nr:Asp-tRNA(Asn)/Glu-tRNA(Gln) amidotransferase subunit GatC [Myxococcaceae bacterium]MBH2006868.1 Asp-tRNA(Asn)/Glu-tRNA(Gln) amidotransferase subunit GatC [Myxococcaceae bacterium]
MDFSFEDMQKLARLSRLALSEAELNDRKKDLEQILSHITSLQNLSVENIEPMTHAVPIELFQRSDVAMTGIGRQGLCGSAGFEEGLIKVPKIIE